MRKFTQLIRSEEETRLDIFCNNLKKRESERIVEVLKRMEFTFCYVEPDSILAFLTGQYSIIKYVVQMLEKYYGFSWDRRPAILGVPDHEIVQDFLKKSIK